MIGKNYAQALQVQLKTQGVQFGKDFLRNTDDGESFSVAIDTYQGIQTAGKSVDVGSKASKYVAKQVNFAPQKMRRAFKQAQWWQQRIFQWWRSPQQKSYSTNHNFLIGSLHLILPLNAILIQQI